MATPRNTSDERLFPNSTARWYSRRQNGWNGNHVEVLPYRGWKVQATAGNHSIYGGFERPDAPNTFSLHEFNEYSGIPAWAQPGYNRAYGKFRDAAYGSNSQLGVFFAEWKQSFGMVSQRALGLATAARHLTNGRFRQALNALSVSPKRKHRNKVSNTANEASGLWLEYWFGWSPSISDIYNSLEETVTPLPVGYFEGGATSRDVRIAYGGWKEKYTYQRAIRHKVGGTVRVTNPNLFLFNQLGLVNPASIAWELIPFSFLVDWVSDVGSYVESFTDFVGVEVQAPWSSHRLKFHDESDWFDWHIVGPPATVFGYASIRKTSIARPLPNMQITANLGQSLTRTASAVSLLTQLLQSMKK